MNTATAIKLFDNHKVQTIWNAEQEKWYFSIVDVIAVLTESPNPNNYWKVFKFRLKEEGNESVTNCNQLKLESSDGKFYLTDVGDTELVLNMLAEVATKEISQTENPTEFHKSKQIANRGSTVARDARQSLEKQTGKPVITSNNNVTKKKNILQ